MKKSQRDLSLRRREVERRYDAAAKLIFRDKLVLARLIRLLYALIYDRSMSDLKVKIEKEWVIPKNENPRLIQGLETERTDPIHGKIDGDLLTEVEIFDDGSVYSWLLNLEIQNTFHPGYNLLKRASYQSARYLADQKNVTFTGNHFDLILKVVGMWICTNPPAGYRNTVYFYPRNQILLHGEGKPFPAADYDLDVIALICLGGPKHKNYNGIIKLVGTLLSETLSEEEREQILWNEFHIPMAEQLKKEVYKMTEAGAEMYDLGKSEGLILGKAAGIEEGGEMMLLKTIEAITSNLNISIEQAIEVCNVSQADRDKILQQLKKNKSC